MNSKPLVAVPITQVQAPLSDSNPAVDQASNHYSDTQMEGPQPLAVTSSKQLSDRITTLSQKKHLYLDTEANNATAFNEVVCRINSTKQSLFFEKINEVTDDQINTLDDLCENPPFSTPTDTPSFKLFASEQFPYIALKAFRKDKINISEFSTLISLHALHHQLKEKKSMTHAALFEESGEPNKEAWDRIKESLIVSNHISSIFHFFWITSIIQKIQTTLRECRPIESSLWYYYEGRRDHEPSTVSDQIKKVGLHALFVDIASVDLTSSILDLTTSRLYPSVSLRQAFLSASFQDEAHQLNPVIGISTTEQIRIGGLRGYRDFALPFPGLSLPNSADNYPAPLIADFQFHDFYHAVRASRLKNDDIHLYISIGDALEELKSKYTTAIAKLEELISRQLSVFKNFLKTYRSEETDHINRIFYQKYYCKPFRLIRYLKYGKRATGCLKFNLYDMEHLNIRPFKEDDQYMTEEFYANNQHWYNLSGSMLKNYNTYFLSGIRAELAGRAVRPIILNKSPSFCQSVDSGLIKLETRRNELITLIEALPSTGPKELACIESQIRFYNPMKTESPAQ